MTVSNVQSLLLISSLMLALPLHTRGRPSSQPHQDQRHEKKTVLLDIQVMNSKTGVFVSGLKQDDLLIYEYGVKQKVTGFAEQDLPLSLILLVDLSGSLGHSIKPILKKVVPALQNLRPNDEAALMTFTSQARLVQDFTTDKQLVAESINKVIKQVLDSEAGTAIDEAVYQAAAHLRRVSGRKSRRVIIAITDNEPSNEFTHYFTLGHTKGETMRELATVEGIVCGLVVPNTGERLEKQFRPPGPDSGNIPLYAKRTGGIYWRVMDEEVGLKLGEVINVLRKRYLLEYQTLVLRGNNESRRIQLRILPEEERREGKLATVTRLVQ